MRAGSLFCVQVHTHAPEGDCRRGAGAAQIYYQGKDVRIMEQINGGDFRIIDDCLLIRLPEEIDHHGAGAICENADKYLLREEVRNVIFDFEKTKFMDSSGIGIIMGRYRKIACFGGCVYAIHADSQIQRIFRLSGLNKIVEVLES